MTSPFVESYFGDYSPFKEEISPSIQTEEDISLLEIFTRYNAGGLLYRDFDPNRVVSNLPLLYQDAQGNIPATQSGDRIGLVLDSSQGLAQAITTLSTTVADWTLTGASAVNTGDRLDLTSSGGSNSARRSFSTFANVWYKFTATVRVPASNSVANCGKISLGDQDTNSVAVTAEDQDQTLSVWFRATGASTEVYLQCESSSQNGANGDVTYFSNISMTSVEGNHAFQETDSLRPTLAGGGTDPWYISFNGTDQYLNTGAPPGNSFTACCGVRASTADGTILGAATTSTTERVNIELNSSSQLQFRLGSVVLSGSTNIASQDLVASFYASTGLSELFLNEERLAFSEASPGTFANSVPVTIGAKNTTTVPANYQSMRLYSLFAIGTSVEFFDLLRAREVLMAEIGV